MTNYILYLGLECLEPKQEKPQSYHFYYSSPVPFKGNEFSEDENWRESLDDLHLNLLMFKKPLVKGSWPGTVYRGAMEGDYFKLSEGVPTRYPNQNFCQLLIANHVTATNYYKTVAREYNQLKQDEFKDELERLRVLYNSIPYKRQPMFLAYVIKFLTR